MDNKLINIISDITYHKGVEYYVFKKINYVQPINEHEYEADVSGTETYHVILNDEDISVSSCTCPYFADKHQICKHIVAVYISLHPDIAKEDIELYQSFIPKKPKKPRRVKPPVVKEPPVEEVPPVVIKPHRKQHIPIEPISKNVKIN